MTSFPPNQEKTNEDLNKNLLENQITNMLNQIMNEENEENNENSSSPPDKSSSFVKTEHPSLCRANKKYPTIGSMHSQKNILPQFNINNSDYYMQFPFNNNNFQNMCFTPVNLMMYQNNFQQVLPTTPTLFRPNNCRQQSFDVRKKRMNQYDMSYSNNKQNSNHVNNQLDVMIYELQINLIKSEKIDKETFTGIKNDFIKIIKTHKGSRIFQNYLKNTEPEIIFEIFKQIKPSLIELMTDFYANYFCKKFYFFLQINERISFLNEIYNSIPSLSINPIATYPIQSIIELIKTNQEKQIVVSSVKNSLSSLFLDTYGIHVIEKIILGFEEEWSLFIYEFIMNNFMFLANNNNAICIIKKILVFPHNKNIHERIKEFATNNSLQLLENPYGNYVIQVIVENWDEKEVLEVTSKFKGIFCELSNKKYASNVIERCLEKHPSILTMYLNEVCQNGRIGEIMKNSYGNYVIQKALKITTGKEKTFLIENIDKNIYKLNDKKLIMKWKNMISSSN